MSWSQNTSGLGADVIAALSEWPGKVVAQDRQYNATEELADKTDAEAAGSNVAYTSPAGYAIIYAPVLVMRPHRPTANSTPSALLQQIALPAAAPIADVKESK